MAVFSRDEIAAAFRICRRTRELAEHWHARSDLLTEDVLPGVTTREPAEHRG